ncbi:MAG: type IX secretion system outer membrane channel protein PorV [Bacteroidota bacterium]|nr:type IX secretion system outer membrane channel protein PorV [Bacteroidota bacterium]
MKKKSAALILLFLLFTGSIRLFSQELNAIQTVVPFLTIAPDSRSGAMGDAGVATTPDIYSQHWNPAKFAFIDGKAGVGISYSPWLRNLVPDINIAYLTGYYRVDKKQVASASMLYSSLGDVPFTDEFGNLERTFKPNELAFDLGYSRIFAENFSGGIAFRFIYSNLTGGTYSGGEATRPGISFAADISGYYRKDVTIFSKKAEIGAGLNFSNIGSKMSYSSGQTSDFIPMNMRLGSAGTINFDNFNKLSLALDFNKLLVPTPPIRDNNGNIIDGKDPNVSVPVAIFQSFYDAPGGFKEEIREITTSIGTEYWYNNQFAIRAGYFHENQSKGNRKYFTAGAGFRFKGFQIDFSYLMPTVANHPLARTLRFSLAFDMNSLKKASVSTQ